MDLYERARAIMPGHIHVLVNLASVYRASGRLQDARRTLEDALQVDRHFAIAHNNLGNVLIDLGERGQARRSYERAAALDPSYADPLAGLAAIAEEQHRLDDARRLAESALRIAPQNVLSQLTLARVRMRSDDAAGAANLLEELIPNALLSVTNRIFAQGALGEAYDRLGRYGEAFTAFSKANALQHEQCAPTFLHAQGPLAPTSIARLTASVAGLDHATWRPAPSAELTPVFLVGFPRSGTTLLEQVLASHADITTLEERDTLIDATAELLGPASALEHWADLPTGEIERLRDLYWQRVTAALGQTPLRRILVDKQPLNAALLPLIHRLFPSAAIVFSIRDPRDVLISCYQQRFGMNEAMFQLLRLDTATAYYDAVMRLLEASRNRLPLRLRAVKYEDLVTNFEATVRGLLAFLGLEWDEGVRRYSETARTRTIQTPSAAQVVRPLYTSSCGRWRNYREFLGPYLPALTPWVKSLGYEM
jgi:tetratricopeptide (TPR) repeat protein